MFLMPGGRNENELLSGIDPIHWVEQLNLVTPLMRHSKMNAWTLSV